MAKDPTTLAEATAYHEKITARCLECLECLKDPEQRGFMAESSTSLLLGAQAWLSVIGQIDKGLQMVLTGDCTAELAAKTLDDASWDAIRRTLDDERYVAQYGNPWPTCEMIRYATKRGMAMDAGMTRDFHRLVGDRLRAPQTGNAWNAAVAQAWHSYWLTPDSIGRAAMTIAAAD